MEKSELYSLLEFTFLRKWKEEAEEYDCIFKQKEKELTEELAADLNEKGNRLLALLILAVEDKIEYINHYLNIKFLNFGVKLGLDLQRAFTEYE